MRNVIKRRLQMSISYAFPIKHLSQAKNFFFRKVYLMMIVYLFLYQKILLNGVVNFFFRMVYQKLVWYLFLCKVILLNDEEMEF